MNSKMKKSLVKIPSITDLKPNAPGIIVGIYQGERTLLEEEIGFADVMTSEPIARDMHFRVGSLTKTFTTTVILCLVDKGLLSLDDRVASFLNEWHLPATLTVKHLGNMTSGLFNYSEDAGFLKALTDNPAREWTREQLLALALNGKNKHYFEPGKGWYYSNTNTVLLGLIAEKLTGKSIEELCTELVFTPLGLHSTSLATTSAMPYPFARGYMYGYVDGRSPEGVFREVTENNPSWANAAGVGISTLDDLRRYIPAFVYGDLLSEKTQEERNATFVRRTVADYGFGLFRMYGHWYGHNGEIPGYQSFAVYSPLLEVTVIVLCNLHSEPAGVGPADLIGKEILAAFEVAHTRDESLHFRVVS